MEKTLGVKEFLSLSDRVHMPSLRFALRLALLSDAYCGDLIKDDERLLRLISPTIIWPSAVVDELWGKFDKFNKGSAAYPVHDALTFVQLLLANQGELWTLHHDYILRTWESTPQFVQQAFSETLKTLDSELLCHHSEHPNLQHVKALYQLDSLESAILEFAVTAHQRPRFREFLRHVPLASMGAAWTVIAAMVGCSELELRTALKLTGRLRRCDLIKFDGAPDHLEEFVRVGYVAFRLFQLHADSASDLQATLLDPIGTSPLVLDDFPHLTNEIDAIVRALKKAVHSRDVGINILIQGPAGSGKHELANLMIQATGFAGFQIGNINPGAEPSTEQEKRIERLNLTHQILQTHSGAIVVFDGLRDAARFCEPIVKEQLETSTCPIIWIDDGSRPLSGTILRHFVYHLDLKQTPISARKHTASKLLANIGVDSGVLDSIVSDPDISPAQIAMAARFARLSGNAIPSLEAKALLSALDAGQRIKGASSLSLDQAGFDSCWDIDALNLETSAPLLRILDALGRTRCASLAFHGLPGTGKTSLAAYIAQTLDRPLITKRVSDLSSKWIGDTEKAIANMFREAATENAVLLLDEGDSFLRDRRLARSSWEVTQVNELLQQMESFKGIFICATNLMDDIDTAALRRFTFKIKFLPLDNQRRRRMLASYALANAEADLPAPIDHRLNALSQLAAGDFATVRRQEALINERFSLEVWITELEREHALRTPWAKQRPAFV